MRLTSTSLAAAVTLALVGCAGTPPPGSQTVARAKCQRQTGSMLCSSPDDQPTGDTNSAAIQQTANGAGGSR